ncbi:unnamed protein product [Penicillium salamii]|uniref:Zn(2)-C6 fungal-type domain-containing protein n=1 Tax=Penicillium salamii TaxID=1612424 RepID=A0A9W4IUU3_9EURO|nr:unnamed protein product [Penicillium salamii]
MDNDPLINASTFDAQDLRATTRINRIPRACERCRFRKIRCDGLQPCKRCDEQKESCSYRPGRPRTRKQYRKLPWTSQTKSPRPQPNGASPGLSGGPTSSDPRPLESQATLRPDQWRQSLRAGIGVTDSRTGAPQFYGPSSHFAFVQRIYERLSSKSHEPITPSPQSPIPEGVRVWGLERFLFSASEKQNINPTGEAFISRNIGERFIRNYFKIIHPQLPILIFSDIMSHWASIWGPPSRHCAPQDRRLVYMVLAFGARVSPAKDPDNTELTDEWAEYLLRKTDVSMLELSEPTMHLVQLLLLKATYAQQLMRPNETYLHLGYAARAASSLGINRSTILAAADSQIHQMRLTFWIMFAMEKITALLVGRPSSLRDDQIDAPYPSEHLQSNDMPMHDIKQFAHGQNDSIFVRLMVELGKLADKILTSIYSVKEVTAQEQYLIEKKMIECEEMLTSISESLPTHLNFLDEESSIGEDWQETQRLHLGLVYHSMRMLIHRPVMVFTTFFPSSQIAQLHAPGVIQLQQSNGASIASARSIILLARESFFTRLPEVRYDGSLASYIVAACITLLYEVLDPATDVTHAKETFTLVEQAIECLDTMKHLGPQTGKKMSSDIMQMAKNVLFSSPQGQVVDEFLMEEFPWLR